MYRKNLARLKNCMRRAEAGEELTLGFFGGSITQGSLATKHEYCYAYRVFRWWEEAFPKAKFHYINGGIGRTTSHYGVSRVVNDLLMYQPDFVVVDFSVNDKPEDFFQETYEGLIRKLLIWLQSRPELMHSVSQFFAHDAVRFISGAVSCKYFLNSGPADPLRNFPDIFFRLIVQMKSADQRPHLPSRMPMYFQSPSLIL